MLEYIKKHPVIVGVIAIGGAFVFYELALAGSSSTAATTYDTGASADQIQSTVDQGAIQANAQQQLNNAQFQISYLQQQQSGDYAIANLNAQTSTVQQVNAIQGQIAITDVNADVTKNSISTQAAVTEYGLDTQKSIQDSINATSTALAKISSDTTLGYATIVNNAAVQTATINANTTTTLGGYQAGVAIDNINASRDIAIGAQNVQKQVSSNDLLGTVVKGIFSLF